METFPLESLSIEEATQMQFRFVDAYNQKLLR